MITNITRIVCVTCHYPKRYDVQAIHSYIRVRITISSFMHKIIKHYTCINNVPSEAHFNIQEDAEISPFIIMNSKYSVFCHAKQRWNLYLKREAVAENNIAVVNNNRISSTKKHAWKRGLYTEHQTCVSIQHPPQGICPTNLCV